MLTRKIQDHSIVYYQEDRQVLALEEEKTDSGILIRIKGQLRSEAGHDLLDELTALATAGLTVTLDLAQTTYITATIQDVLVTVQQTMDTMGRGELILRNIPEPVYRELRKTGIDNSLMIEE